VRIFLDANILFAAAFLDGSIRRFLAVLKAGSHVLCADAYVVEEARRNLATKKPQSLAFFAMLLDGLEIVPMQSVGSIPAQAMALPDKDRPVLAAAIRTHCDVLLTGDQADFGPFFGKVIAGVTIHSPQTLAATLFK
jgi:predicted nucleic acid-binding protein